MSPFDRLLTEMRKRPVWQMAGVYLAGCWLVLQVLDVLAQNLEFPPWVFPSALLLLLLGLPVVLLTAAVQRDPVGAADAGSRGIRRVVTWRNAAIGGVAAFAVWGLVSATLLLLGGRTSAAADAAGGAPGANKLAVLPFTFQGGEEYSYLGDGIVDLLSTKLDGAGELRAVDPRAILSRAGIEGARGLGPTEAADFAERVGAGMFILGSIIEVGGRLTVSAALYQPRTSLEPLAEATATGETAAIFESLDQVAAQLLAGVGRGPAARVRRLAAVTTGSLPALRAYLAGERAYRGGQYGEAVMAFQRAVELDTTYALAYYRLSVVAEFSTLSELAQEAAELAVRHADRLSTRDRALLDAFLAWRRGTHAEAERLYRGLVRAYPDEIEAWFELGEVLIHGNPLHGRSFTEAWEPFRRVLELDPQNTAAMYHLARIASVLGRYPQLDSLVESHRRLNPGGDRELEILSLQAFSRPDSPEQEEVLLRLRSGTDVGVALAGWDAATWTEDVAGAREVIAIQTDASRPPEVRTLGHAWLAHLELAAGRIEVAREHLARMRRLDPVAALEYRAILAANPLMRSTPEELRSLAAELEALDPTQVQPSRNPSIFYSVHDSLHPLLRSYLLGVVRAMLGDEAGALQAAGATEGIRLGPAEGSLGRDLAASVRAQTHWRSGRHQEALRALDGIRREVWYIGTLSSTFYGQALERFLRGELLFQLGRLEEAIPWFENISQIAPYELAYRPLAYERLGQIHERLGDPAKAARYYDQLATLWREAEPALRERAHAARARVAYEATRQ